MDRIIEVKVSGNYLSKDNKVAGVKGEANVTNLHIAFDEGWDTFSKRITFWDALGNNPTKILLDNKRECVAPIPGEAMAEAGKLTFVIDGYNGGKKQRSVADELEVKDAPMAENAAEPIDPTPDLAAQLQKFIDDHKNDKVNPHETTAKQTGALPIEGGTLKGPLYVRPDGNRTPEVRLQPSGSGGDGSVLKIGDGNGLDGETVLTDNIGSSDFVRLAISNKRTKRDLASGVLFKNYVNGVGTDYKIYGEHNKPKASDVGAYSKDEADEFLDNLSEEMQNELANKVDKVTGKGLSTNDFTNEHKAKLEGMDEAVDEKLEALSVKLDKHQTDTNTALNLKADKSSVYTKSETDSKLYTKANADNVYTKSETDSKLNAKANADSVYTKTETDSKLNDKADKNNVFSKDEMADILDTKADKSDIVGVYKFAGSVDKFEDLPGGSLKVLEFTSDAVDSNNNTVAEYSASDKTLEFNFGEEISPYDDVKITIPCKEIFLKAGTYRVEDLFSGVSFECYGSRSYQFYIGDGINRCYLSDMYSYQESDQFKVYNDITVNCLTIESQATYFHEGELNVITGTCSSEIKIISIAEEILPIGVVVNVLEDGMNYAWTGEKWDALGGGQKDLEVRKELETKADKSELVGVYKYKGSVDTKADMPQKYKILKINGNAKDSFGDNAAFYNGEDEEFDTLIVSYEKEYSPYVNCVITIPCEETTLMPGQYTFRSDFGDVEFGSGREFKFYIGDGINEICFGSCNSQNFAYQTFTVEEELKVTCINIRANATYGSYETIELYGPLLIDVKFEDHSFATEVGEVYNVRESGMNYAWDGEEWDGLGRDGVDEKTQELLSDIEWLREYRESSLQTAMRFDDYVQLINYFNSTDSATNSYGEPIAVSAWFGDYIHIRDESLPDLMVRKPYDMPKDCLLTTNDEFLAELKAKGFVRVGYVELSIAALTYPQVNEIVGEKAATSKTEYITDFTETDPQKGTEVTVNGNKVHLLHEEFDNSAGLWRYCLIAFPLGVVSELKDKVFSYKTDVPFDNILLITAPTSTQKNFGVMDSYNGKEFVPYDIAMSKTTPPNKTDTLYMGFMLSNLKTQSVHPYVEGDITVYKVGNIVADKLSDNLQAELDAKYLSNDTTEKYITCWGDSLTAMGGWTTKLQELSGLTVHNGGVGGENTDCIIARQGADAMTVNNVTIPANAVAMLLARNSDNGILTEFGNRVKPALQHASNLNPVMIGDVEGTLYKADSGWFFTRSKAGEEVVIDRPTAIRTNHDINHNSPYLMVIYMGQNDAKYDSSNANIEENLAELIRKHRLMIEHAHAENVIVLGLSSGTAESRATYEATMRKEFGRNFISLREYLATPIYDGGNIVSCYGLADQNLEMGTAEYNGTTYNSVDEIAVGAVPHQLLRDNVHYTNDTMTVVGNYVYKKCCELGIF